MTREEHKKNFAENFPKLYSERWIEVGKTDELFIKVLSAETGRNCTSSNLKRWINGESVPEVYLTHISDVLECEVCDLIGENIERIKHYTGEKPKKKKASEMTVIEYRGAVLNEMCKAIDRMRNAETAEFIEGMREAMKVMYDYDFNELEPETPSWVERNNRKCI